MLQQPTTWDELKKSADIYIEQIKQIKEAKPNKEEDKPNKEEDKPNKEEDKSKKLSNGYDDEESVTHFRSTKDSAFWNNFTSVQDLYKKYGKVVDESNKSIHNLDDEIDSLAFWLSEDRIKKKQSGEAKSFPKSKKRKFYHYNNISNKEGKKPNSTHSTISLLKVTGYSVYISTPNTEVFNIQSNETLTDINSVNKSDSSVNESDQSVNILNMSVTTELKTSVNESDQSVNISNMSVSTELKTSDQSVNESDQSVNKSVSSVNESDQSVNISNMSVTTELKTSDQSVNKSVSSVNESDQSVNIPNMSVTTELKSSVNETSEPKYLEIEKLTELFKENRCVFIPSRYRSNSIKFNISLNTRTYTATDEFNIFDKESKTIPIIVVDCDEFDEYRSLLGAKNVIISKPPNHFGVGASRFWCQMIAEALELKYCWMVDDSTEQLFNSTKKIENKEQNEKKEQIENNKQTENKKCEKEIYIEASTMDVFLAVENVVKYCENNNVHIGLSGIEKRFEIFTGGCVISQKYVGNMVLLNIEKLKEKKVYYRCELFSRKEDILFAYECFKSGLNVCKVRHFHLVDSTTDADTGNAVVATPNYDEYLDSTELKDNVEFKECKYLLNSITDLKSKLLNIHYMLGESYKKLGDYTQSFYHFHVFGSKKIESNFSNLYGALEMCVLLEYPKEQAKKFIEALEKIDKTSEEIDKVKILKKKLGYCESSESSSNM